MGVRTTATASSIIYTIWPDKDLDDGDFLQILKTNLKRRRNVAIWRNFQQHDKRIEFKGPVLETDRYIGLKIFDLLNIDRYATSNLTMIRDAR